MRSRSFIVYGIPAPAGSKRGFYNQKSKRVIITDDSKRSRPWKAQVADRAGLAMEGAELLSGALSFTVTFVMPRPKSHYGKSGLLASAPFHHITRPDASKLTRAVEDAILGIVYRDDAQIVQQVIHKMYGEPARAEITVLELPT